MYYYVFLKHILTVHELNQQSELKSIYFSLHLVLATTVFRSYLSLLYCLCSGCHFEWNTFFIFFFWLYNICPLLNGFPWGGNEASLHVLFIFILTLSPKNLIYKLNLIMLPLYLFYSNKTSKSHL